MTDANSVPMRMVDPVGMAKTAADPEERRTGHKATRHPTEAYREAVASGKERPVWQDHGRDDPRRAAARDRLHEYLDGLGSRLPTPDELARLTALASRAFEPRSAASRTFAVFVRVVEDLLSRTAKA